MRAEQLPSYAEKNQQDYAEPLDCFREALEEIDQHDLATSLPPERSERPGTTG